MTERSRSTTRIAAGARGADLRVTLASAWHRRLGVPGIAMILPDGTEVAARGALVATLRLKTWGAVTALLLRDQERVFRSYLDQDLDFVVTGDPAETLLGIIGVMDEKSRDYHWLAAALSSSRYFWQQTTPFRRTNLGVHYSVPAPFWLSFLRNEYPIYSHYLFHDDETHEDWEAACERKLQFALEACRMQPGARVLNVGEGWAGFLAFAGRRGMHVTGLTLNDESYQACLAKIAAESLGGTCQVVQVDFYQYEAVQPFDAITNMGVTEHLTDYDALMAKYASLLKPGGHVYCDFVGIVRDRHFGSIVQKYIYPGAEPVYLPKLLDAAARSNIMDVVATYDDRLSYEKTCVAWARNVEARRDMIVESFGEAKYRWIWSYLWMCVHGFRSWNVGLTGTRVVLRRR